MRKISKMMLSLWMFSMGLGMLSAPVHAMTSQASFTVVDVNEGQPSVQPPTIHGAQQVVIKTKATTGQLPQTSVAEQVAWPALWLLGLTLLVLIIRNWRRLIPIKRR